MQQRDGDDEGEVEPVGNVDVGLFPLHERAHEEDEVAHPDDGQPQVGVPFGFRVFLALRGTEDIAGRGEQDHDLVAPEHEPGEAIIPEPRTRGALDHVEGRGDERRAPEGEDHRRGVQRTQPPEVEEAFRPGEVELGKRQHEGDVGPHEEAHDAPEGGQGCPDPDGSVEVAGFRSRFMPHTPQRIDEQATRDRHDQNGVDQIGEIAGIGGGDRGQKCNQAEDHQFEVIPHFTSLRVFHYAVRTGDESRPARAFRLTGVLMCRGGSNLDPCQNPQGFVKLAI